MAEGPYGRFIPPFCRGVVCSDLCDLRPVQVLRLKGCSTDKEVYPLIIYILSLLAGGGVEGRGDTSRSGLWVTPQELSIDAERVPPSPKW